MDNSANTCWTIAGAMNDCANDADVDGYYEAFDSWYWKASRHKDATTSLADDVFTKFGVDAGHRAYHLYNEGIAGGNYATDLHKLGAQSLAIQDTDWDLSDGAVFGITDKDLGYLDALKTVWWNDVLANSDLLLNSPVTGIDTSGSDVIVTDANGDQHAARQVIVTVSIAVLQSEMINFTPDLPASTVDAYNGIGMDHGMKIPMRFSLAWWETEGAMSWLVTEGLASACWAPSNYKATTQSHIMMCYPMGDNAAALNDIAIAAGGGAAGDAAIIEAVLADLDATFPQALYQASANYVDGIVQNWGAAPYTLGAYSYPKVGTFEKRTTSQRENLQAAVANNRIFFAGEGSHITHPATVVGALHEGERAANAVASANGTPNNPPVLPGGGGPDTTAPVITLNGSASMSVVENTTFTDPGATASDDVDGDISGSIQVSGSVDTSTVGSYTLTYAVSDAAGNSASADRTVTVTTAGGGTFSELFFDNFEVEDNWGNWIDGGTDAKFYYRGGTHAVGQNSIELQRGGADATISTVNLALSGNSEVKVEFVYAAKGMDNNEYFQLQINTGSGYQTVQQWTKGVDFANNESKLESVTISGISLTDQTKLRFRNFANNGRDEVYIDDIRVSVK